MTSLEKLKREMKIVRRALRTDKEGYDEDGYDAEGYDRYGRSREMMERSAKEEQMAFDSLTPDKQAFVMKAYSVAQQYLEKAIEWENQPEDFKRQSPFYEEYMMHSDITKRSFLLGHFISANPEHEKMSLEACSILIKARNKLFPRHGDIH